MLFENFERPCVIMEKSRVNDPEGGWETKWTEGAEFSNYYHLDTSLEARVAEKQGVTSVYNALVDKSVPIQYGDYFKDNSTGKYYRVTSEPEEREAPSVSTLKIKFFTAEAKAGLPA